MVPWHFQKSFRELKGFYWILSFLSYEAGWVAVGRVLAESTGYRGRVSQDQPDPQETVSKEKGKKNPLCHIQHIGNCSRNLRLKKIRYILLSVWANNKDTH